MILCLIALGLCYIVWCLEGGHSALILLRVEVGLLAAAIVCMTLGIIQIAHKIL